MGNVGAPGIPGRDGKNGQQGVNGKDGDVGVPGPQVSSNNAFVLYFLFHFSQVLRILFLSTFHLFIRVSKAYREHLA